MPRQTHSDSTAVSEKTTAKTRAKSRGHATGETWVADVVITHPDRVLFADSSITKGELALYYDAIAPRMLPYVANRPLSVVRCPQGAASAASACFYQKHWTGVLPKGVKAIDITESDGATGRYVYVSDAEGIVSLVQYGVLEFHLWGSRVDDVDAPDRIVIDLDPAMDVAWARVVETAASIGELLRVCKLQSWVQTTGGKGVHLVVPIARHSTWDDVRECSRLIASHIVSTNPAGLVDVASKAARPGRIFIDYLRNSRGATAVAPWSSRARACGPISIPRSWTELLEMKTRPSTCLSDVWNELSKSTVDPWATMAASRQRLTKRVLQALRDQ